ncbi:DNA polymerase [Mitsuokella jalaludinii]|uniref:DNA polymerase n=1 Tax=Mitsuokella jalaludinii TaxID=187979 RepID=UPI00307A4DBB
MSTLCIDIETYSDADIKLGVHKYVDSHNFRVLLLAYAFDSEPVEVVDLARGESIPERVKAALYNPAITKTAFNANFEITCLRKLFSDLPDGSWECDSVLALYHALPTSLDAVGKALGLPQDKMKDARGKRLITYFCKPCRPTKKNGGRTRNLPDDAPEDWGIFKEYNRQDVVTEREIRRRLLWLKPSEQEHRLWLVDRAINDRGIGIDCKLVESAIDLNTEMAQELMVKAQELTGLENPNSIQQLQGWLRMNGVMLTGLTKVSVAEALQDTSLHPVVREVLRIRQALGKTSIKKYEAMKKSICRDGRAHDLFQFYGAARTGRWAGRNIQLQNLPRNYLEDLDAARETVKEDDYGWMATMYENVPDVLSQLIRTALVPRPGNRFIVADFSAIEARVIAWVAGERWRKDAFAEGADIYCASASQMFHVPVVKHGVNGHLRQRGKIAELALGYGGGINALKAMGADKLGLSDAELEDIVTKWREASPSIPRLWHKIESAAMRAVRATALNDDGKVYRMDTGKRELRKFPVTGNIYFARVHGCLLLHLPSGRWLVYPKARIGENRFGRPSIIYEGLEQTTRRWGELETYGGKLTENLIQGIARDCLGAAMLRLEAAGYKIVAHIHDEVVLDVPQDFGSLADAIRIMVQNEPWNQGLLMNADGFEGAYYKKD